MKNKCAFCLTGVLALSLLVGCGKKEEAPESSAEAAPEPPPASAPNSVDYLGAMSRAKTTAEKVVDVSSVQQAIDLFHAAEDRFPENLNELVSTGYLPRLPQLPKGYQFAYFPKSGRVKAIVMTPPGGAPSQQ
jgi:hypothetical protein